LHQGTQPESKHAAVYTFALFSVQGRISIGVMALAQTCCEPDLHNSTGQWGVHFAKNSVAVLWCWVNAQLHGEQISIGVLAVTQACSQPGL